jgi:hypothetical protein
LKLLVLVEIAALLAIGAGFALREAGVFRDREIRGSQPPEGQQAPDLAGLDGIEPASKISPKGTGRPELVFVSCLRCTSGVAIGGLLQRFDFEAAPDEARVSVIAVDDGYEAWKASGQVPSGVRVSGTTPAAAAEVQRLTHVGKSGIAFLYDADGTWRATYQLGQMREADMVHDLWAVE